MKKSVLLLFAAAMVAMTVFMSTSCSKDEKDDAPQEPIIVSSPVINPECTDMNCWWGRNKQPSIISWSEPEVSGNNKVDFEYQFLILEDFGAGIWKSFARQKQTYVSINWDYRFYPAFNDYFPYFEHKPLPAFDNIPLNYLDSLQCRNYRYKIRAYYKTDKLEDAYVESDIAMFYVDAFLSAKTLFANNQMTIIWHFPKSNLKKVVVFLCNNNNEDQIEGMIAGKIERDEEYLQKYCKEISPDTESVTFDKPDSPDKFNQYNVIVYGPEPGFECRTREYVDFNSEWK